jgi:hypothetical protein
MLTAADTRDAMERMGEHWLIPLMDFVDDFRRRRDPAAIAQPFRLRGDRFDALLAAVVETLCSESGVEPPEWVHAVPGCRQPFFVSGVESLKAITLVESPAHFRARNIFVLDNFLSRV